MDTYAPDFPSDFQKANDDICKVFKKHNLHLGRMIGSSKSLYRKNNPDNLIVFNANVISESKGKIWYGDLDLTKDHDILSEVAKELGESLYILYEHDARFGSENQDAKILIEKSVMKILCN